MGPLDGAWWPRSADPVAELPPLIRAVEVSRGRITHLMLQAEGWRSQPRRMTVDGRVIRLGWFTSGPAGLLTTTNSGRDRVDLLVVPPTLSKAAAAAAMAAASDPTNTLRTPEILAAVNTTDPAALDRWESDGGHLRTAAA
ncbi:DUF5994 family protein [Fodinicola feengrottensis]|uniref:DUF5994 family protein n=3 Tax=Fodinicola feengrottensis TaxID=435914 RepID=A0ABN2FUN2_9ACTN